MTEVRLVVADPGPGIGITIRESGKVGVKVTTVARPVRLSMAVPGVQGPPGERGPAGPGGGGYQEHVQATPAKVWTVSHDFGRPPAVTVVDVDGNEIDAGVFYPDDQTVIITLGPATAGRAHLT